MTLLPLHPRHGGRRTLWKDADDYSPRHFLFLTANDIEVFFLRLERASGGVARPRQKVVPLRADKLNDAGQRREKSSHKVNNLTLQSEKLPTSSLSTFSKTATCRVSCTYSFFSPPPPRGHNNYRGSKEPFIYLFLSNSLHEG